MPTYITLTNYTQHGIENIKDSPTRLDQAKEVVASVGGEFKDFYLTMGQYDIVFIADFPDDEAAAKAMLTIAKGGSVRSETLKAFNEHEYRDVIGTLD
ncbi:GYD domain-containing protein [Halorarius litoreus]|uniref:GYD domain-containing protein n=1 Tax=Halorarius litoreus TaxID=2962676 RepID=UPI0020CD3321|nr:GYD domain-containing protein [Halorarius litoreus]